MLKYGILTGIFLSMFPFQFLCFIVVRLLLGFRHFIPYMSQTNTIRKQKLYLDFKQSCKNQYRSSKCTYDCCRQAKYTMLWTTFKSVMGGCWLYTDLLPVTDDDTMIYHGWLLTILWSVMGGCWLYFDLSWVAADYTLICYQWQISFWSVMCITWLHCVVGVR